MKQDDIISAYKKVVDQFTAIEVAIRAMMKLLPDAPVAEGEAPHKMITADMDTCLRVGQMHLDDSRLRVNAVFQDMLRHSEEFALQAMAAQGAAPDADQDIPDADQDAPAPDFTPKAGAPDGDS